MPLRNGNGAADCYPGGVSMGFYLTRRAWDSGRRDAAVALFEELTGESLYDGIWACASLLHVRGEDLPDVMNRLAGLLEMADDEFSRIRTEIT